MASSFISVPVKKTFEVDLITPLRYFISNAYPNTRQDEYSYALSEFNKLRNNFIGKLGDKHESALDVFYRYYDQLNAIECKFPITENQVRINFKWQDAFMKESRSAPKKLLTIAAGAYEKICVLFDVAAMQTQVVELQEITSDDGLKMAAKLFQQSSGIFAHLASMVPSVILCDPTPDLHADSLNALSAVVLAQAQDCFVRKAINDKMKPGVIAKLSEQCSSLYNDAVKLMQLDSVKTLWPKEWLPAVTCRKEIFGALAQYHQSQLAKESKNFGEEVVRVKIANEAMTKAVKQLGSNQSTFQAYQKMILEAFQKAEKDNNFVYHAKLPDVASLAPIEKAVLAKPSPISNPMSANFKDLFERIVPMAVQNAMASFDERKSEIIFKEITKLRNATQILNSMLVSLNLPAAIEDLTGDSVPTSLQEKAANVRRLGGIEQMTRLTNELPALVQRNKEILDECEKTLNEEEMSDRQLRGQYRQYWTRTPSEVLNQQIRGECASYRKIINSALQADGLVRQRYLKSRDAIGLLSLPDTDIERALPSGSPADQLQTSPVVATLRQLMDQVRAIKEERDVLESQLKDNKSDMTSKFLAALAQDGAIYEQTLSIEQLDRIYGPLKEQVAQNLKKQDIAVDQIQKNNSEFTRAKVQTNTGANRDYKLKELAAAFDSFTEVKGNIEEGIQFYNDLTQLLVKFQGKVNDFCFARKAERDELMKDLSSILANQPLSPPPQQNFSGHQMFSNVAVMSTNPSGFAHPSAQSSYAASNAASFFAPAMPRSYNPYANFTVTQNPQQFGGYQWR